MAASRTTSKSSSFFCCFLTAQVELLRDKDPLNLCTPCNGFAGSSVARLMLVFVRDKSVESAYPCNPLPKQFRPRHKSLPRRDDERVTSRRA